MNYPIHPKIDRPRNASDFIVGASHLGMPAWPPIPRGRYVDQGLFEAEIARVWRRSWLLVAHVSEFEKQGSYRQIDLPFAPLITVKGPDDTLRSFYNSCRHRGSMVVRNKEGCARRFTCIYHGWTYDNFGRLVGVPEQDKFPGLVLEDAGLVNVRTELWGGFVFVNLDQDAPLLLEWLGPTILNHYSAIVESPIRIASKETFEVDCNWKLSSEAFRETYHIRTIHSRTAATTAASSDSRFEMHPNGHGTIILPQKKKVTDKDWLKGGGKEGDTLAGLNGFDKPEFQGNVMALELFPNVTAPMHEIGVPIITTWPISVTRSRIELTWYVRDWGPGPRPSDWDRMIADFTALTWEDINNLQVQQKPIEADVETTVPFGSMECLLYLLHTEVDRLVGAENIPVKLRVEDISEDYLIS